MSQINVLLVASLVLAELCNPSLLAAQETRVPPGSTRGLLGGGRAVVDPNATSQTFLVTVDLAAGYDEAEVPTDDLSGEFGFLPTGYSQTAATSLQYRYGRASRFVMVTAGGSVNRQPLGIDDQTGQLVRGEGRVQVALPLGRRAGVTADVGAAYEPAYLFNAFGNVAAVPAPNDATPIVGGPSTPPVAVTTQQWITQSGAASLFRNITSRQRLSLSFNAANRQPVEGPGFESRSRLTSLAHEWSLRRSLSFNTTYRYLDVAQTEDDGTERPFSSHTLSSGLQVIRRISPTRQLSFVAGGGLTQLRSRRVLGGQPVEYLAPVATGSVRLGLTPDWSVSADAMRDVMLLDGLSPEPFGTSTVALTVGGRAGERFRLNLATNYSRGSSQVSDTGAFRAFGGSAEVVYGLSRYFGITASYAFYDHSLSDGTVLGASPFPARYQRNSVRVGAAVWLPMFGSF